MSQVTLAIHPTDLMDFDAKTEEKAVEVTTDHAASSYGHPVVVIDGEAHGPADLPPNATLEFPTDGAGNVIDVEMYAAAQRAGFTCHSGRRSK